VAVDASGTFSETKRQAGLLRMLPAGVVLSDYAGCSIRLIDCEWFRTEARFVAEPRQSRPPARSWLLRRARPRKNRALPGRRCFILDRFTEIKEKSAIDRFSFGRDVPAASVGGLRCSVAYSLEHWNAAGGLSYSSSALLSSTFIRNR
jgi:hypothetical protein